MPKHFAFHGAFFCFRRETDWSKVLCNGTENRVDHTVLTRFMILGYSGTHTAKPPLTDERQQAQCLEGMFCVTYYRVWEQAKVVARYFCMNLHAVFVSEGLYGSRDPYCLAAAPCGPRRTEFRQAKALAVNYIHTTGVPAECKATPLYYFCNFCFLISVP